jgi:UPF0755 protein
MFRKLGLVFIGLLGIAYFLFFKYSNVETEYILKIKEKKSMGYVFKLLNENNVIKNKQLFDLTQLVLDVKFVPKGHYKITKSMTSLDILRKLRNGYQDPIRFTISTGTFIEDIAGRVGSKLIFDSTEFMAVLLSDSNKMKYNYDEKTVLSCFIPNTIDLYWTSSPQLFISKWMDLHQKFWTLERKVKLEKLNLNPTQLYTLASLVQKEYARKDERSRIAGVLINRLKMTMPLQVDATCKYATRDFAAKRVLNFHTTYPSEYNTYIHQGLPPGPICIPEIETIDDVLNIENHEFIYYCADPSLNGYHIFSKTYAEHENIAQTYRQKMNTMGIK